MQDRGRKEGLPHEVTPLCGGKGKQQILQKEKTDSNHLPGGKTKKGGGSTRKRKKEKGLLLPKRKISSARASEKKEIPYVF